MCSTSYICLLDRLIKKFGICDKLDNVFLKPISFFLTYNLVFQRRTYFLDFQTVCVAPIQHTLCRMRTAACVRTRAHRQSCTNLHPQYALRVSLCAPRIMLYMFFFAQRPAQYIHITHTPDGRHAIWVASSSIHSRFLARIG